MSTSVPGERTRTPTVFEQQREELVREIAVGMEEVLQNINRLNRNLEGIIAVGNEFSSVEALWSQFENFMGRDGEEGAGEGHAEGEVQDDHDQHEDSQVEESGRGSATGIKDER